MHTNISIGGDSGSSVGITGVHLLLCVSLQFILSVTMMTSVD
jgi:hypothetical protein